MKKVLVHGLKKLLPQAWVKWIQAYRRSRRDAKRQTMGSGQSFSKLINTPGSSFFIYVDPLKNGGVDETIAQTGIWEPHVTRVFSTLLKSGGVMVDIGANIGFHSLFAASLSPAVSVYAFEPNGDVADQFTESIKKNSLSNIYLYRVGLSDTETERTLYVRDENTGGATLTETVAEIDFRVHHTMVVSLRKLDLELAEVERVDVIKIDVEGHEYEALKGASQLLETWHPTIIMEFSPAFYEADYSGKSLNFITYLRNYGYEFYTTESLQLIDLEQWIIEKDLGVSQIDIVGIATKQPVGALHAEKLLKFI